MKALRANKHYPLHCLASPPRWRALCSTLPCGSLCGLYLVLHNAPLYRSHLARAGLGYVATCFVSDCNREHDGVDALQIGAIPTLLSSGLAGMVHYLTAIVE